MGQKKILSSYLQRANVVGIVHSAGGIPAALAAPQSALDLLEIRLDLLRGISPDSLAALGQRFPLLLTSRDPSEGGRPGTTPTQRRRWLESALPAATLVDVELAKWDDWSDLLSGSPAQRVVSFHHFTGTPHLAELKRHFARARRVGADVFKVATQIRNGADLAVLLALLESRDGFPVAAMGMGPLGRASRLVLAAAGSCLNYGWLHRPQVPGQFPALVLKERLAEVGA